MTVLVTGGLGYIGSHVVRLLKTQGHKVVVVDDVSTGFMHRLDGNTLIELDLASPNAVATLVATMRDFEVDSVIHLAARKRVGESVEKPEWYFQQNIGGLTNLLSAMREASVTRLVFSSSAATYGMPDVELVTEDLNCKPISPYGETKLVGEWLVADAEKAWGLRSTSLRYFNVAGTGWPELADTEVANLVPIVFQSLLRNQKPKVFGNDYPTPDGTCIRDYVHVVDLADAHVAALDYLNQPQREYNVFNVGTAKGSSVLEVLDEVKSVTGINFDHELVARRAGDPARLCADVSRINKVLGWSAKLTLHDMIDSAWQAAKARDNN